MPAQEGSAYILQHRPWGEKAVVATLFCTTHGLTKGLLKRANPSTLQPFNLVRYRHTRRLDSQLGTLTLELEKSHAPLWLGHPLKALALAAAADVLAALLPEGHPYPVLAQLIPNLLASDLHWRAYAGFERVLAEQVGYGLQLHNPVVGPESTGSGAELAYVSPNTWRSVTRATARGYEHRLLALPHCWGGPSVPESTDCAAAFALTTALLAQALHGPFAAEKMAARSRLLAAYGAAQGSPALAA